MEKGRTNFSQSYPKIVRQSEIVMFVLFLYATYQTVVIFIFKYIYITFIGKFKYLFKYLVVNFG